MRTGSWSKRCPIWSRTSGRPPRPIYTIPNFQNPSGTTMSRERRELLLELAEKWGRVHRRRRPVRRPSLRGATRSPGFLELSPGKSEGHPGPHVLQDAGPGPARGLDGARPLPPGHRGQRKNRPWTRAPAFRCRRSSRTTSRKGKLDEHIDWLRSIYRERKEAMTQALAERFGDDIRSTDPDGGFFLWIDLQGKYSGIDTEELFPLALRHGVAYIPGPAFTDSGSQRHSLRLCFATSLARTDPRGCREARDSIGRVRGAAAGDSLMTSIDLAATDTRRAEKVTESIDAESIVALAEELIRAGGENPRRHGGSDRRLLVRGARGDRGTDRGRRGGSGPFEPDGQARRRRDRERWRPLPRPQ
jgi:hypothetical protein